MTNGATLRVMHSPLRSCLPRIAIPNHGYPRKRREFERPIVAENIYANRSRNPVEGWEEEEG